MLKRGLVQIQLGENRANARIVRKTGAGFSLLETLIATGVLIVVIMGVTSLSNSLIVGTVVSADKTIINRWASEGIELTQKIRDDNLLNKATASTTTNWFAPAVADNGGGYGWYKLQPGSAANTWQLEPASNANNLNKINFISDAGTSLSSDTTTGYRLICVEAVGAKDDGGSQDDFRCNTTNNQRINDGSRSQLSTCQVNGGKYDLYCQMTFESINRNRLTSLEDKIIPPGNAVKIRSVVIWEDKDQIRSSSMATLITNWKGYEQ